MFKYAPCSIAPRLYINYSWKTSVHIIYVVMPVWPFVVKVCFLLLCVNIRELHVFQVSCFAMSLDTLLVYELKILKDTKKR